MRHNYEPANLPCIGCKTWTMHYYRKHARVRADVKDIAFRVLYICSSCGMERVWGYEQTFRLSEDGEQQRDLR